MRLLLLAGTRDSVQIAGALAREHRVAATASLAGPVRSPVPMGVPTRIGGWGGDDAFRDWLGRERVRAIVDATHPFAVGISRRAFDAARDLGIDYLRFQRPPWKPGPEDRWTFLNDWGEIAVKVPVGAAVLIDTDGRGTTSLDGLDGRRVHCRLDPLEADARSLRPGWHVLDGRATITIEGERRLYEALRLDWIVLPNVGGIEEVPKLEAARRVGLGIGIVRRPPQPEAHRAETLSEVMGWVRRRL